MSPLDDFTASAFYSPHLLLIHLLCRFFLIVPSKMRKAQGLKLIQVRDNASGFALGLVYPELEVGGAVVEDDAVLFYGDDPAVVHHVADADYSFADYRLGAAALPDDAV